MLVRINEVAGMLGVSSRSAWRMRDSGALPPPVVLGRLVRWRRNDIVRWIEDGCPDVRRSGWVPEGGAR